MKVLYKGQPAEVWEISKTNEQPEWVKLAFEENYLYWMDNHLRVLMSGLNPSMGTNLKFGAVGTVGGGFAGYDMYVLGYPGDYLDVTNHRVVSKKKFLKQYRVLEDA
ncbi:role in replication [Lacticaseibacillus parahuelsenbergensis]|uniref:Role in replication n=1 Tax=Lacticaseibacillus parahuelsenbergensis TaxID=3068305 RepID=A0ABY9L2Z3_9LACO|nr:MULTISPECIES: role in replication [Lacticaseibacillus]MDE3281189.1 role in replication [Lacticaseibacillus casei]WLV78118.1 role in replication [Lacticaseibacillus sp. NCIMB 15471]